MERWHLPSVEAAGKREPRVLFSRSEARGVLLDLQEGDGLGEHRLYESAVVLVVTGTVTVEKDGVVIECEAGTLVKFEPGEARSLEAREASRILFLLVPWPGDGHFHADAEVDPERIAAQAAEPPLAH